MACTMQAMKEALQMMIKRYNKKLLLNGTI